MQKYNLKFKIRKSLSILLLLFLFIQAPILQLLTPRTYAQELTAPIIEPSPTTVPSPTPTLSTTPPLIVDDTTVTPAPQSNEMFNLDPSNIGQGSAAFRPPTVLRGLLKRNFKAGEKIKLTVANADINDFTTKIEYNDGSVVDIPTQEIKNGSDTLVQIDPPRAFKPGKYTATITVNGTSFEQDFTWGVLAINTNKSFYLPQEEAKLAIAVLDEKGEMVCDAKVELRIQNVNLGINDTLSTENGDIKTSSTCTQKAMILEADYGATYRVSGIGTYNLTLTATSPNGIYTIDDQFEVKESVDFDIERITATRLYPPEVYPVTFKMKANRDFTGTVTEIVPESFGITQLEGGIQYKEVKASDDETLEKEEVLGISTIGYPFAGDEPITQGFGKPERDPLMKKLYFNFGVAGHDGMDFGLAEGTPVLSVDKGTVALADYGGVYGSTIVIEHAWGKSYYGHLSKFDIELGDTVTRGQQIAHSGSTGLSTGPHLHFGIKLNDNNFENGFYGKSNPASFLGIRETADVLGTSTASQPFQVISWDISVKKGQEITFGYKFKSPNISPQLYRIGPLKFFESGKLGTVFEESRQWKLAIDAPENEFVKTGSFTKRTSTGSQSITGIGFKPKAIVFYWTDQTTGEANASNGSNVAGNFGMGFATGSASERALSVWDEGQTNPTTNDSGRASYNNASIVFQGNLGVLTLGIADLTSFDADGFTLNWSVADGNAYIIHYYALSETIITNAIADTFTVTTSTGTVNVTNAGFQPDFVLLMSDGGTTHGSNIQEATWLLGAADSSSSRWTVAGRSDDAVDVSDSCSQQLTNAVLTLIGTTVACGTTTEDALADFTQFTSNGFDINVTNAPAANMDVFYLALKGPEASFKAGSFIESNIGDTSTSETGVGFLPKGIFTASRGSGTSATVDANSGFFVGSSSGSDKNGVIGQLTADGVDAATPDTWTDRTKVFSVYTGDTPSFDANASLKSFDADGFSFTYTVAGPTANEILYWSVGSFFEPTDLMRHGKWFYNGTEQPFAF